MSHPFGNILSGKESALIVREDLNFIAALERNPIAPGHVILIAKPSIDDFFDLPDDALCDFFAFAKPIRSALLTLVPCEKVGFSVLGLIARQAHVHLVPLRSADDLNFTRPKLIVPEAELFTLAERVRRHLSANG